MVPQIPSCFTAFVMFMNLAAIALLHPLFVEEGGFFDDDRTKVATFIEVSSPEKLENLQSLNDQAENIVVNLLEWQVHKSLSICFY